MESRRVRRGYRASVDFGCGRRRGRPGGSRVHQAEEEQAVCPQPDDLPDDATSLGLVPGEDQAAVHGEREVEQLHAASQGKARASTISRPVGWDPNRERAWLGNSFPSHPDPAHRLARGRVGSSGRAPGPSWGALGYVRRNQVGGISRRGALGYVRRNQVGGISRRGALGYVRRNQVGGISRCTGRRMCPRASRSALAHSPVDAPTRSTCPGRATRSRAGGVAFACLPVRGPARSTRPGRATRSARVESPSLVFLSMVRRGLRPGRGSIPSPRPCHR